MKRNGALYHLMALIAVIFWGLTFISTKVLIINGLNPVEIFLIRFSIAYVVALLFSHSKLKADSVREEAMMLAAGVTGGSFYYVVENSALEYTFASNVSLIICCAPIFTILLGKYIFKDKVKAYVWIGSILAFLGVGVVILSSTGEYGINPIGDFLTLLAALSWAIYSLLLKKLTPKYGDMFITRKVFGYGVVTGVIFYFILPYSTTIEVENIWSVIGNLLFLSLGASFLCYYLWNNAIRHLGAERTSNYIYLNPLITIIASSIILSEPFSAIMALGTALIIGGVILSTR